MVRMQMVIVALVVVVCGSTAEARGRRAMYQPAYTQYYNTAVPMTTTAPTNTIIQTNSVAPTTGVVQASATETTTAPTTATPATAAAPANAPAAAPAATTTAAPATTTPKVAAVGSAQWKAEQSARMCSVQHIGGGFGGGSYEGNGFGATADQAIRNSCYWGQLTPIEIGVARGANGYYATIFYR